MRQQSMLALRQSEEWVAFDRHMRALAEATYKSGGFGTPRRTFSLF
jgi:hypothetical protein